MHISTIATLAALAMPFTSAQLSSIPQCAVSLPPCLNARSLVFQSVNNGLGKRDRIRHYSRRLHRRRRPLLLHPRIHGLPPIPNRPHLQCF